jgi:hypothetical protein
MLMVEIGSRYQQILFDDVPCTFEENSNEPIWSRSLFRWQIFDSCMQLIHQEFFLQMLQVVLLDIQKIPV